MSNIFEKMWDGLKQIIYEFRQPKEVREKTRKHIKSKGKKMIDEAIVYERFVKTYNVDVNRGIKGATPEYVDFKVASYRPVYSDSQAIRGTEIHFSDLTSNYGTHFEQGNKILVEELVSENKDLKEILGKDFKVTESNVFARDKTT